MPDPIKDRLERFQELERSLSDPKILADPQRVKEYARQMAQLKPIVERYRELKHVEEQMASVESMLEANETPPELREMALGEMDQLMKKQMDLKRQLEDLLLGSDPEGDRSIVMEIRAGTGGAEASLFAMDLYRMYTRYADRQGWTAESLSMSPTKVGGFKEVIFALEGVGVYRRMRFESGVHRVQRIPVTEASGRIHTSTATVAVLPQAEEVEVQIDPKDLRVDVFRASGPGGQGVNTTDSAVRITHLPTGIVVSCQDERSQIKNRAKAMKVLRARLWELYSHKQAEERSHQRRIQIGTGERSEKIRTYNFPDRRVTDHRIGYTSHRLEEILDGDLDELLDALMEAERRARGL
jgi:peptide chain release factor 1